MYLKILSFFINTYLTSEIITVSKMWSIQPRAPDSLIKYLLVTFLGSRCDQQTIKENSLNDFILNSSQRLVNNKRRWPGLTGESRHWCSSCSLTDTQFEEEKKTSSLKWTVYRGMCPPRSVPGQVEDSRVKKWIQMSLSTDWLSGVLLCSESCWLKMLACV